MRTHSTLVYVILFSVLTLYCSAQNEVDWKTIKGKDFGFTTWQSLVFRPDVTFNEVRKSFYKEWNGKKYQAHKSFKDFKRMEHEMAGLYDIPYIERYQFLRNRTKKSKVLHGSSNWSLLGPISPPSGNNEGIGRINDIEFHPNDQNLIYISAPNGGVWKTTNGCDSWSNLSASFDSETVLDIEIDSANPDRIYACSSAGLYRTLDGGMSWNKINSIFFRRIESVPNTSIMYAISFYTAYRSSDDGQNWTQITAPGFDDTYQKYDIAFKSNDYNTVYISRQGGIAKSTDGGQSFTLMPLPFDESQVRMVYLSTTADNVDAVYCSAADLTSDLFGVYKSQNNGSSWNQIMSIGDSIKGVDGTATGIGSQYFWGYNDLPISVSPDDEDEIHIGNVSLFRTKDGGQNWTIVSSDRYNGGSVHVDMMDVKYNPSTGKAFVGCDGGLYRHDIDGQKWKRLNNNLPVTQIYRSTVSQRVTGKHIIGNQDNGIMKFQDNNWLFELVGDGMESYIFEYDPNVIISATQYGNFKISSDNGLSWESMITRNITGENASWTAPLVIHPSLEFKLFTGYQSVWMSKDEGKNWENISGILSSTGRTLNYLDISAFDPNHILAATYDELFVSTNGGSSWSLISNRPAGTIRSIKWSKDNNDMLLATNSDIHKTTDLGASWANFSQGLTSGAESYYDLEVFDNGIQEYYLAGFGTVYHRTDQTNWAPYFNNLPKTPVYDLDIDYIEGKIVAATHGRGLWQSNLKSSSTTACYNFDIPEVYQTSPITGCGEGTSLSANPSPTGIYQWYKDGEVISGVNSQHLAISESGTYHLYYPANGGPACRGYASGPIIFSENCSFSSCSDLNSQSNLGFDYPTVIQVENNFPELSQDPEICITATGDLSASYETFNIYDEDEVLRGMTNTGSDCGGPVPDFCFTASALTYNQWIADGIITVTLRPNSSGINPMLCSTNEACATINIVPNTQSSNCQNNWNLFNDITGIYDQSQKITVTDGLLLGSNHSVLTAEQDISIFPNFETQLGSMLELSIENCN